METRITVPIQKIDSDRRIFGGWAYVAKRADGIQVVDHSGDVVDTAEAWDALKDAAYEYAVEVRAGDDEHEVFEVAKLAEFFVSDPERWETMGLPEGVLPQGIFMSFRADRTPEGDRLWEKARNGGMLSIVGEGRREPL